MEGLSAFLGAITPELVVRAILQVILLSMAAAFAGSETALFSLSRLDIRKLQATRAPRVERIQEMLREPRNLIISILCGNETVMIATSVNMTAMLLMFFSEEETRWINLFVMVPMLLLFGEVTPKTFAVTFPSMFAVNLTSRFLPKWIHLITPIRLAVRVVADLCTSFIVGEPVKKENILQADAFRALVEEGEATGVIDPKERVLIDNMLAASETELIHVMTPTTRMDFIDSDQPMAKILEDFRKCKHPHMPVIRRHRDNIIGFLEAADLHALVAKKTDFSKLKITDILRPAHFVPPNKKVDEMFDYFHENDTWAAIVLGEYGEVYGIITISDVLHFVFSDSSTQVEEASDEIQKEEDGSYIIPGDMHLPQVNLVTDLELDEVDDSMVTTMGGYAFQQFDRLPSVGESVEVDGIRLIVLEMDNLRIKTLQVIRFRPKAEKDVAAGEESAEAGEENGHGNGHF